MTNPPGGARVSPYESALGARLGELHPRLRRYFSAIPAGMVGEGHGLFNVVGTPRLWLWPALSVLARRGIVFPVWQHDVPFTVTNRPLATGVPAVSAVRSFRFTAGDRDMVDEISCSDGTLVDRLGTGGLLVATFSAEVDSGRLCLESTRVGVVLRGRTLWIPRIIAPRVSLVESFDEERDRQHVNVELRHPLLGRFYEYAGWFAYELRPGESSS